MKEKQILVVIKRPGEAAYVEPLFENTLEAFQKEVGGYIEAYTVAEDLALICNDEGRLRGLPYNLTVLGEHFVGTVIAVGVKGEEFASIHGSCVSLVLRIMNGGRGK